MAFIEKVDEVNMELKENVKLGKTILPIDTEGAFGIIQALPTHFSDSIPRKSLGTRPFILMDDFFEYSGKSYYDEDLKLGVWIHKNE